MLEKNITIKGIFTAILVLTIGFSQVSLEIKNVDLTAGTLDIYMTNVAGCSYCTDNTYNEKEHCELYGSDPSTAATILDATWKFSSDIDKATCESTTTNGVYFSGELKAFQFYLQGITITGVSSGTAEQYLDFIDLGVGEIVLGSSFGTSFIPAGSGVLITVAFSNAEAGICFVESGCLDDYDNDSSTPKTIVYDVDCTYPGVAAANILSDNNGNAIDGDWGECYCASELDECGECGGDGIDEGVCDCVGNVEDCAGICGGTTTDSDSDGVCDTADGCTDTASGEIVDANGCSASQLSISQTGTALPTEFSIAQNFPNPFNPVTSITFDVAEMDEVSLVVYDLTGKEVITLVSGIYTPGTYNVEWNAINNAGGSIVSGMYIYRYITSEKAIVRKMLYLK